MFGSHEKLTHFQLHALILCSESVVPTPSISHEGESARLHQRKQTNYSLKTERSFQRNWLCRHWLRRFRAAVGIYFSLLGYQARAPTCAQSPRMLTPPPTRGAGCAGGILMVPKFSHLNGHHTATEPLISAAWFSHQNRCHLSFYCFRPINGRFPPRV